MLYDGAATCRRTCQIKVPCEGGEDYSRTSWALDSARPLGVCDSRLSCEWLVRCICKERSITVFPLVFPSIFSSNC